MLHLISMKKSIWCKHHLSIFCKDYLFLLFVYIFALFSLLCLNTDIRFFQYSCKIPQLHFYTSSHVNADEEGSMLCLSLPRRSVPIYFYLHLTVQLFPFILLYLPFILHNSIESWSLYFKGSCLQARIQDFGRLFFIWRAEGVAP